MTGTDLVFAQASLLERRRWAEDISRAGDLVPSGFRNRDGSANAAKVLLAAETGVMLGVHPIAALQGIHVIEGKPTISPALMSALVRRAGHKLRVTTTGTVADKSFAATAVLIRRDDPTFEYRATWNLERATRAGLVGKNVWKNYFEAMAKARAISEVIREGAEDVLMGAAYVPEELGADVNEDGVPVAPSDDIEDAEVVDEATGEVDGQQRPVWGDRWEPTPWEDAIADALASGGDAVARLRHVYRDASQRGVLQQRMANGRTLADTLTSLGKRAEQDQQNEDTEDGAA